MEYDTKVDPSGRPMKLKIRSDGRKVEVWDAETGLPVKNITRLEILFTPSSSHARIDVVDCPILEIDNIPAESNVTEIQAEEEE